MNITAILKVVLTKAIFLIIYVCWLNLIEFVIKRRWYNGQHSCLPSSWSGFDSRPTQDPFGNFFLIFLIVWYGAKHKKCYFKILKNVFLKKLSMPWPGFEPGLLRPQRRVLTTRRSRLAREMNWLAHNVGSINDLMSGRCHSPIGTWECQQVFVV